MSAPYEEIRNGLITFIGEALDEEQDNLVKAVGMMSEKGLKLTLGATILPTDDLTVNEIQVKLSFVPEKVQVKTEGFTERLKKAVNAVHALKKVKG